jgi:3-oxoacyl-[acyl-carrier protein] reductase
MTRPVALVTGAARGIGHAVAHALAAAGYDLAITDVEDPSEAVYSLQSLGVRAHGETFDLADLSCHAPALARIEATVGPVDLLVNNAGRGSVLRGDLLDLSPENFDTVLSVNLRGTVFLTQAVVKRMLAAPSPYPRAIITITSVSAEAASPERTDYCVSKAGLSMAVKALALRLASTGIGVYEIRPGIIATDMTAGVRDKYDRLIEAGLVPQARWGYPDDIARAIVALAGGAFAFSQGQIIDIDGGLSLPRL